MVKGLVDFRTRNLLLPLDVLLLRLTSLDFLLGLSVRVVCSVRSLLLQEPAIFLKLLVPTFLESVLKYLRVVDELDCIVGIF